MRRGLQPAELHLLHRILWRREAYPSPRAALLKGPFQASILSTSIELTPHSVVVLAARTQYWLSVYPEGQSSPRCKPISLEDAAKGRTGSIGKHTTAGIHEPSGEEPWASDQRR